MAKLAGYLESVSIHSVRGWFVGAEVSAVLISINKNPFYCAFLDVARDDVVRVVKSDTKLVGFNAKLSLRSGDLVTVTDIDKNYQLKHSPRVFVEDDFLDMSLLSRDEYSKLSFIKHASVFDGFIPLQGMGEISSALVLKGNQKFIIKSCHSTNDHNYLRLLYKDILPRYDVHSPRYIESFSHDYIAYSYCEGSSLKYKNINNDFLLKICRELDKLKDLSKDELIFSSDEKPFYKNLILISFLKAFKYSSLVTILRIYRYWSTIKNSDVVFSHGDLHLKNIIMDGDNPFIIDWGSASFLPVGYDLACLLKGCDPELISSLKIDKDIKLNVIIFIYFFKAYEGSSFFGSENEAQILNLFDSQV